MDAVDLGYYLATSVLGALAMYIAMKKRLADANKAAADAKKTLAEVEKTAAETANLLEAKNKTLADTEKLLAETQQVVLGHTKMRLDIQGQQLDLQTRLDEEAGRYKDANHAFADKIDAMATAIGERGDGSQFRADAIRCLTAEVIPTFMSYVEKSKVVYVDASPEVVAIFIESDIAAFMTELDTALDVLNDDQVLAGCPSSTEPLKVSLASLGSAKMVLVELSKKLDEGQWVPLRRQIKRSRTGKLLGLK